jgi:hypothetical protein
MPAHYSEIEMQITQASLSKSHDNNTVDLIADKIFSEAIDNGKENPGTVNSGHDMWNGGPDCLAPAESFIASALKDAVKLRLDESLDASYTPISIYSAFKNTTEKNPNHPALGNLVYEFVKKKRNQICFVCF